jgi:hypothetical protein
MCCTVTYPPKKAKVKLVGADTTITTCTLAMGSRLLHTSFVKFERSELTFHRHLGKVFSMKMSYASAPRWCIQDTYVMRTLDICTCKSLNWPPVRVAVTFMISFVLQKLTFKAHTVHTVYTGNAHQTRTRQQSVMFT